MIRTVYRVRCELAGARLAFDQMQQEINTLKERMDGIVDAQRELEQALFQEA